MNADRLAQAISIAHTIVLSESVKSGLGKPRYLIPRSDLRQLEQVELTTQVLRIIKLTYCTASNRSRYPVPMDRRSGKIRNSRIAPSTRQASFFLQGFLLRDDSIRGSLGYGRQYSCGPSVWG